MFLGLDFLSMLVILGFGAVILYPMGFLHRRKIFHLSLLQILYLIAIPGFLFVLGNSYMNEVLARPSVEDVFLSDSLLVNLILLSMFFMYGGIAVHAVTKMLSESFRGDNDGESAKINEFFHLTFSHNLIYSAMVVVLAGFVMLEINHVNFENPGSLFWYVVKGLVMGTAFVLAMYFYIRPSKNYVNRWADLKAVFFVFWLVGVVFIYGLRRVNSSWTAYDTLIPGIVGFGVVAFLNAVLVFRRLKNGKIVSRLKIDRLFNKNKK